MDYKENFIFIDDYYRKNDNQKDISIVIFSPFYPFNNRFVYTLFSKTKFKDSKFIFSNIETLNGSKNFAYNFINIMDVYCKAIEKINCNDITLVAFGIFTNIFIQIANIFKERINRFILFEPDFSNNALFKMNEGANFIFSNLKSILNFYLEEKSKIDKNFISKNYSKYLKKIFESIRDLSDNNKKLLKELVDNKIETVIFWKIMEKELWPLPQILVEDYGIKAFSLKNNIYKIFIEEDNDIINILNNI
ncbi:MAG TPA: hypothetical protein PLE45_06150 [Spirochaetota bacterium]|nr:hypothetical protein [Spirochaetota bacterium]HOL57586.1 hypothetical protein [Spirochaetota bacterium]HPP04518.1 hypothetical protein [Spirochaetota bacterium]